MIIIFICKNCNKHTEMEGEKKRKYCVRPECLRDRYKKQSRFTPKQSFKSLNVNMKSGRTCQKCGGDTGVNILHCKKCQRELWQGAVMAI